MTWTPIEKRRGSIPVDQISLSVRRRRFSAFIPQSICEALGWEVGTTLEVSRGSDDHAGKMLLRAADDGFLLRAFASRTSRLTVSWPAWAPVRNEDHAATVVGHEITDSALVVVLPIWARKGAILFQSSRFKSGESNVAV